MYVFFVLQGVINALLCYYIFISIIAAIAKKFTDWRSFLVHRLTGARTLPAHFTSKLENGVKSVQKYLTTLFL